MHIEENKIELFIINSEGLNNKEKNEILLHLDSCSYCKEIYNTYNNFYGEIESGTKRKPNINDEDVAQRIMSRIQKSDDSKLLSENSEAVQIHNGKTEIVIRRKLFSLQNIYYFIKNYPIPSFGFAVVTALAIAFVLGQLNKTIKDDNPIYAEVSGGTLNIHNSLGEILWKKPGYELPVTTSNLLMNWIYRAQRHVNVVDINNDGKNEVFISGEYDAKYTLRSDSLYCYDYKGEKLWTAFPESKGTNYAPQWKRTKWVIRDFFTAKYRKTKRLFVVANDKAYGGSIISEIDSKTGIVLSSIYHSGWPSTDFTSDIDGDGIDELFIGCISSYGKPSLIILDQNHLKGVLPDYYSSFQMVKAEAMYYILLPLSDLSKLSITLIDKDITEIRETTNYGYTVMVADYHSGHFQNEHSDVQYLFDKQFRIISVYPGSGIEQLIKKGILGGKLTSSYWASLKDSIKYWDGDRFVNYPVKNKYWKK